MSAVGLQPTDRGLVPLETDRGEIVVHPNHNYLRAGFSKNFARHWFDARHSEVLTLIQPLRVPDR
jgi:hypothetical protein